jgi:DNA-binding NtrC family response regulator
VANSKILVVDDDANLLALVEHHLGSEGFPVVGVSSGRDAIQAFKAVKPAAVVLDLLLPDVSGKDLLAQFHEQQPELPVIILTASTGIDDAVECMRLGAVDYLQKPFDRTRLVTSVRNACTQGQLRARVETLSSELRKREGFSTILGRSPSIRNMVHMLGRAATSDVTVLLQGESGTGKEVAAHSIHAESVRAAGPFIAVNCGAIPEGLIESELFGHEKGAFTGAASSRRGSFEQADGGTIFLDEIGELRSDLQVRMLRVLQERTVQPVGGGAERKIDVRIIAATNRELREEVTNGRFREDLYYRLAVFPVSLPSLRERDGDVMLLAGAFLKRFADQTQRDVIALAPETQRAFEQYGWPGNVRELENVIERAVLLEDGERIGLGAIPAEIVAALGDEAAHRRAAVEGGGGILADVGLPGNKEAILPLEEEERRIIRRALELTNWNIQEASRRLRIGRATIYRKIERYGLRSAEDAML